VPCAAKNRSTASAIWPGFFAGATWSSPGKLNKDVPDLLGTGREPLVSLDPDGVPARALGSVLRHPDPADPQRPTGRQAPDGNRPGAAVQNLGTIRAVIQKPGDPSAVRHAGDRLNPDGVPVLPGAARHQVAHLVHAAGRDVEDIPASNRWEKGRPPGRDGAIAEDLKVNRRIRGRRDLVTDHVRIQSRRGLARPKAQAAEVNENQFTRRGGDGPEFLDSRLRPGRHPINHGYKVSAIRRFR
jgi:hypothetical protein